VTAEIYNWGRLHQAAKVIPH